VSAFARENGTNKSDDEVVLPFHKKIVLPVDFENSTKEKIGTNIEKKLLPALNKYLKQYNITLCEIEVTIGMNGEVVKVQIGGEDLSQLHKNVLLKIVQRQNYEKYKLIYVWKYKIVF